MEANTKNKRLMPALVGKAFMDWLWDWNCNSAGGKDKGVHLRRPAWETLAKELAEATGESYQTMSFYTGRLSWHVGPNFEDTLIDPSSAKSLINAIAHGVETLAGQEIDSKIRIAQRASLILGSLADEFAWTASAYLVHLLAQECGDADSETTNAEHGRAGRFAAKLMNAGLSLTAKNPNDCVYPIGKAVAHAILVGTADQTEEQLDAS